MTTAKIFRCGTAQAVQLPKRYQFKAKEVEIFRRGDEIVLRKKKSWNDARLRAPGELTLGLPN